MDERNNRKHGIVFYLVISLIAIAILGGVIFSILDTSLQKKVLAFGNQLPIINQVIPDPAQKQESKSKDQDFWKQKYFNTDAMVKEKDQTIADLNQKLNSNQQVVIDLKKSNQDLQNQLDQKQSKAVQNQMKQIADIYANMNASKAASIVESMSLEDASLTMSMLDADQQSNILGSMKDAKKAAEITMMMKEIAGLTETDPNALKEQVHQLVLNQENPAASLADTIAAMPSAQSAGIIQSMMGSNSQVAMDLMKNVPTKSRSQILAEIEKTDAALAAQITASLNK